MRLSAFSSFSKSPQLQNRLSAKLKRLDFITDDLTSALEMVEKIVKNTQYIYICDLSEDISLKTVIVEAIVNTCPKILDKAQHAFFMNQPPLLHNILIGEQKEYDKGVERDNIHSNLNGVNIITLLRLNVSASTDA